MQLILASASQGRKQLLSLFQIPFQVIPSTVDEDKIIGKNPLETIQLRARGKGENVFNNLTMKQFNNEEILIISADSGAILDNKLIGKPKDKKEAIRILQRFSGRTHEFITAIYTINISFQESMIEDAGDAREGLPREASPSSNRNILGELEANLGKLERQDPQTKIYSAFDRSFVTMRKLSEEDINLHIKLSEYTKYAGGYALFASPIDLITKVEGSLTNVVGLPLEKLLPILIKNQLIHF